MDYTIIFLDEIQVYPHLISLLKALKTDNKYRYIVSCSLFRRTLRKTFIPIGTIEEASMYPLDFEEFLYAYGGKKSVIEYLRDCYINRISPDESIHDLVLKRFKEYLICGGFPQAVDAYIKQKKYAINQVSSKRNY